MSFKKYVIFFLFLPIMVAFWSQNPPEICGNEIDDDRDGLIDCYDPDCGCTEACAEHYYQACEYDCAYEDSSTLFAMHLKWSSSKSLSNFNTPVVGDLNDDGLPEIVATGWTRGAPEYLSGQVVIFTPQGNSYKPVVINLTVSANLSTIAIADLERDHNPELIIVGKDRKIHLYSSFNGSSISTKRITVNGLVEHIRQAPSVADFDQDGIPEIYTGNDIFTFNSDFSVLAKRLDGKKEDGRRDIFPRAIVPTAPIAVDILSRIDCDGDPDCDGLELVCGPVIYSVDLSNSDGDGYQIKEVYRLPDEQGVKYEDGSVGVADMDLDGYLDVVVHGTWRENGTRVAGTYIYNPILNRVLLRTPSLFNNGVAGSLGSVTIANVYDDTRDGYPIDYPEVVEVCKDRMYCLNINKTDNRTQDGIWWVLPISDNSAFTGTTAFDFNGDGLKEIVYRDEEDLRIIYGGPKPFPAGVDAQRNWAKVSGGSATGTEFPIVADTDNDGHSEIIVVAGSNRSTNGHLRIYESASTPWRPSRPLWNQTQYFNVNINDNLFIPLIQQQHHWVGDNLVLNTFLNQYGNKNYPIADGTPKVLKATCTQTGYDIRVEVCNWGDFPLAANTPVAIYGENPFRNNTQQVASILLGRTLEVDSCMELVIPISGLSDKTIYIVLNVPKSQTTPIRLLEDFPATDIPECDYWNNTDSVHLHRILKTFNLGPDTSVCVIDSLVFEVEDGFVSYHWDNGDTTRYRIARKEGLYWVEVTDQCGNVVRDSIAVSLKAPPPLSIHQDTVICLGESIRIPLQQWPYTSFDWYSDQGKQCLDCSQLKDNPDRNTTYVIHAETIDGCERYDTFTVEVVPPVYAYDTVQICRGDSVYVFDHFVKSMGDFEKLTTSVMGCDSFSNVHVSVVEGPYMELDTSICSGDSLFIFNKWRFASGTFRHQFDVAGGCDSTVVIHLDVSPPIEVQGVWHYFICDSLETIKPNISTHGGKGELVFYWDQSRGPLQIPLGRGKHTLRVVDELGCAVEQAVVVTLEEKPEVDIQVKDISCFGQEDGEIEIVARHQSGRVLYSLNNLDFDEQPPYQNLRAGQYVVYYKDSVGCVFQDTVRIEEPERLTLVISKDTTIQIGENVHLFSRGNYDSSEVTYHWEPSEGLSCTDCPNPIANPSHTTTYTLTVIDEDGCSISRQVTIHVRIDPRVYIPNVFTPNGDNQNDKFVVYANKAIKEVLVFKIFDRWGELIYSNGHFSPNDPAYGWDGNFKNQKMNPGVFVYLARVLTVDGKEFSYTGSLTLVR